MHSLKKYTVLKTAEFGKKCPKPGGVEILVRLLLSPTGIKTTTVSLYIGNGYTFHTPKEKKAIIKKATEDLEKILTGGMNWDKDSDLNYRSSYAGAIFINKMFQGSILHGPKKGELPKTWGSLKEHFEEITNWVESEFSPSQET